MSEARFDNVIHGCWQLAREHRLQPWPPSDIEGQLEDLVLRSRERVTFDCADIYTGVESLLGRVRARLHSSGTDGRMRVHTKYVPDLSELGRLTRNDVRDSLERSCDRLGVERLDLVQFHWWDESVPGFVEVAGWLSELREEGLVSDLGATNFTTPMFRRMLEAGIPLVSHQVQYSMLDRRPAGPMTALCEEYGVRLLAYGSAAGGFLGERWLGERDPLGQESNRSLTKYRLVIEDGGGWAAWQGLLEEISSRSEGTPLALMGAAWSLMQPQVSSVLLGWSDAQRAWEARRLFTEGEAEAEAEGDRPSQSWLGLKDQLEGLEVSSYMREIGGDVYEAERSPGAHSAILKKGLRK